MKKAQDNVAVLDDHVLMSTVNHIKDSYHRKNIGQIEVGEQAQELILRLGVRQKELAQLLGRSQGWLSQAIRMATSPKVPSYVRDAVKDKLLPFHIAVKMAKVPEQEQARIIRNLRNVAKHQEDNYFNHPSVQRDLQIINESTTQNKRDGQNFIAKLEALKEYKEGMRGVIELQIELALGPLRGRPDVTFLEAAKVNGELKALYWLLERIQ